MATFAASIEESQPGRGRFAVGAAVGAGAVAAAATAAGLANGEGPDLWSVLRGSVVASYVLAGAYTWWRRPSSSFGRLLVAVGLVYSVVALAASDESVAHTVGRVTHAALIVVLAYVFLSFPHDRPSGPGERRLVYGLGLSTAVVWAFALPVVETLPSGGPLIACGDSCPPNAFQIVSAPARASSALELAVTGVTAIGLIALVVGLVRKARAPGRLRRRLTLPLLLAVAVLAANYAAFSVLSELGIGPTSFLRGVGAVAALTIPVALLVGQFRGRVFAATGVVELMSRVAQESATPRSLQEVLRSAIGDPVLSLALWRPGTGWVDVDGRPFELPSPGPGSAVTPVTHDGKIGALIHDPVLAESPGLAEGLATAAFVLLENAQLVDELQASRTRIVAASQRERVRLERNLHDGAQQRLFAIELKIRALRGRVRDDALARELDNLAEQTAAASEEMRVLAHGLYPPVLRERGLLDALRAFAQTATVPVRLVDRDVPRCDETVEEAVYFCVLEAVQNVAKHAGAGARATVTLERAGSELELAVEDDGDGFLVHEVEEGIGLVSMRDRIGAVGGRLEIVSRRGAGTTVRGTVPCDGRR